MKKTLLVLIVLIFLSPLVLGGEEWHFNGDTWESNGRIFHIIVNEQTYDMIVLEIDNESLILRTNECEQLGVDEYCFLEVADMDDDEHLYMDSKGIIHRGVKISYTSLEPEVIVTSKLSTTNPLPGQTVTLNITIENKGPLDVTDLELSYDKPIMIKTNRPLRIGPLFLGSNRKYSKLFNLTVDTDQKVELNGSISYIVEGFRREKTLNKITISPKQVYNYNIKIPSQLLVKQEGNLEIEIENYDSKEINITLEINSISILINNSQSIYQKKSLPGGNTTILVFPIKSNIPGSASINIVIRISTTYGSTVIEKKYQLTIIEPDISIAISTSKNKIVEGDEIEAKVIVSNPSSRAMRDINIETNYDCEEHIDIINPGREIEICKKRIIPTRDIVVNVSYNTSTGRKKKTLNKHINIYNLNESIIITNTVTKQEGGIIVETYIEPRTDSPVVVKRIEEKFYNITLLNGKSVAHDISLNKKTMVYTYSASYSACSYIETIAILSFKNREIQVMKNTTIEQCNKEIVNKQQGGESAKQSQQEKEEKKNIISEILSAIARFFSSLFG